MTEEKKKPIRDRRRVMDAKGPYNPKTHRGEFKKPEDPSLQEGEEEGHALLSQREEEWTEQVVREHTQVEKEEDKKWAEKESGRARKGKARST